MILLITGYFDVYDSKGYKTGKKEFVTSHGIDLDSNKVVITPNEHPKELGAKFNEQYMKWSIGN